MTEPARARALSTLVPLAVAATVLAAFGATLRQGRSADASELRRIVEALDVELGDIVADVGAGDGRYAASLAETVGPGGRVYATEVDRRDVERIEERVRAEELDNVVVITGDARDTGLPEACCDAILLRRVYHHFTDPEPMRASLRRSLRRDGRLLVVDFETRRDWSRPEGVPASRDGHGISKELLRAEMERAGFEVLAELDWRGGDYAFVFRVAPVVD